MSEVKILEGVVEMDYKWNPGSTVGRFLTDLRDKQEITAIRCSKTSKVYLPPQSWSPAGNVKMDKFVTLTGKATLEMGTVVHERPWNCPDEIDVPYMLAAVKYQGADTSLLHIVTGDLKKLEALEPGAELKPVWKEKRAGNIRDLDHFEAV